jgi:hypothetical protein
VNSFSALATRGPNPIADAFAWPVTIVCMAGDLFAWLVTMITSDLVRYVHARTMQRAPG